MVKRMLAVDLGASGGKCFAATLDGTSFSMQEVHRFAHEGVSFFLPDRTGSITERTHWDDILLYRQIVTGLQTYRREISNRLDSIGIDTWGADGHIVSEDGEMLGKVYCYRDHRLDTMIEAVKSRIDANRVYSLTGIHFHPFNVSNQLLWLSLNRSDLLRPGCFYLPIPSLFYYYLCGSRSVDSSWASVTQLMDARLRTWNHEIIEALDIPPRILPSIIPPGTVVGSLHKPLADELGLNPAALVATASHDTASAFAAAPVENPDEALIISSGTWSLVGRLIPEPITTPAAMAAGISNEGGIGNVRFLKNCMGTWLAQELRRGWAVQDGRETDWDTLTQMAADAEPFASLINPDDAGFYNPANMETAIADFCRRTGQTPPESRGSFIRTVYESLALKYRQVDADLGRVVGKPTKVVHIVGGGSRNAMLNQFTADCTGLPVLAGPEEATAVGNFMVQAIGLGAIRAIDEAQPIIRSAFQIRRFEPTRRKPWDAAFARFEKLARTP